jgi:hypothetical protein
VSFKFSPIKGITNVYSACSGQDSSILSDIVGEKLNISSNPSRSTSPSIKENCSSSSATKLLRLIPKVNAYQPISQPIKNRSISPANSFQSVLLANTGSLISPVNMIRSISPANSSRSSSPANTSRSISTANDFRLNAEDINLKQSKWKDFQQSLRGKNLGKPVPRKKVVI